MIESHRRLGMVANEQWSPVWAATARYRNPFIANEVRKGLPLVQDFCRILPLCRKLLHPFWRSGLGD